MPINEGDQAPRFELPQKPMDMVNVGDFIGKEKIVLLFFPFAFSPVCTEEMCHFRDTWAQWESLDAKVFAISIDSPFVTNRFKEDQQIPFQVLSVLHQINLPDAVPHRESDYNRLLCVSIRPRPVFF